MLYHRPSILINVVSVAGYNVKIDPGARYIVMAGENMAAVTESTEHLVEMDANNTTLRRDAEIRFFTAERSLTSVLKRTGSENFKGHSVEDLNSYHEFVIQTTAARSLFRHNGRKGVCREERSSREKRRLAIGGDRAKTFLLDEIKPGEEETYN